jgi:hypothetical protein
MVAVLIGLRFLGYRCYCLYRWLSTHQIIRSHFDSLYNVPSSLTVPGGSATATSAFDRLKAYSQDILAFRWAPVGAVLSRMVEWKDRSEECQSGCRSCRLWIHSYCAWMHLPPVPGSKATPHFTQEQPVENIQTTTTWFRTCPPNPTWKSDYNLTPRVLAYDSVAS